MIELIPEYLNPIWTTLVYYSAFLSYVSMFNICICRIRCVTGSRNGEGFGPIKLLAVTLQQWIFDYKVHIHSTFSQLFQKHSVTNLLKDIILQMLKIVIIHYLIIIKPLKI